MASGALGRPFDAPGCTGQDRVFTTVQTELLQQQGAGISQPDHKHPDLRRVAMQIARDLHRRGGDGHRAFADPGFGPDLFRDRECRLVQLIEIRSQHAALGRIRKGLLDLAQDLAFPDDLAFQGTGHVEHMPDRVVVVAAQQMLLDRRRLGPDPFGDQPLQRIDIAVEVRPGDVKFDPVAGRHDDRLADPLFLQSGKDRGTRLVIDEEPVAKPGIRGFVGRPHDGKPGRAGRVEPPVHIQPLSVPAIPLLRRTCSSRVVSPTMPAIRPCRSRTGRRCPAS